jgi:hypothetical protein
VDALREGVRAVRHPFGTRARRRASPAAAAAAVGWTGLGFANKTLDNRPCLRQAKVREPALSQSRVRGRLGSTVPRESDGSMPFL